MQAEAAKSLRVLGIDPFVRGVGFAVLEGRDRLVDWGIKSTGRADNTKSTRIVRALIKRYQPDILAIEDHQSDRSRRCGRVRKLLSALAARGASEVRVILVSHDQLYAIGPRAQTNTKYARACYLAECFPELRAFVPPIRKPWMTESDNMAMFDAASFAIACFLTAPA